MRLKGAGSGTSYHHSGRFVSMMSFKISATCLSLGADKITKKRAYEILKSVKKHASLNNRLQAILDNLVNTMMQHLLEFGLLTRIGNG
jgi:hypothetical protein